MEVFMVARGIHSKGGSSEWAAKNIAGHNRARLVGERFERLSVISEAGRDKHGSVLWNCRCDCGNTLFATTARLRSGHVQSCGCLQKERALQNVRKLHKDSFKHGLGHGNYSPTYKTWTSMRERVNKRESYTRLGVKVCRRWDSFENFLADMGERPDGMSLDRIDPLGDYEPQNCRWATPKQQSQNRTNTVFLRIKGKRVPSTQFAEQFGLHRNEIYAYLKVKAILEKLNE